MKIDIAPYVENLLFHHDALVIPGFGIFTSKQAPAAIDYLGGTIAPPAKVLAFDENVRTDDGILLQKLMDEHQLAPDEARNIIQNYVEALHTILDNREIVTLPGVGRLYKNYARKIQFLPETTNFSTESYGLPSLETKARQVTDASPAAKIALGTTPQVTEEQAKPAPQAAAPQASDARAYSIDTPSSGRVNTWVWPLLGGLLLLGAVLLGYKLMQKKKTEQPAAAVTETKPPAPVAATPIPGVNDLINSQQAQKEKAEPAPVASRNDDIPDGVEEYEAKRSTTTEKKKTEKTDVSTSATQKTEKTSGRRCVLVIGTFQDKANVDKLIAKLKANGYDTYHRRINGHQVGVEFFYNDLTEVQKVMVDLQKLTGQDHIWIKKK